MSQIRIAVIDSGRGGLFLAQQLRTTFPDVEFITETDTANLPYGEKTPAELAVLGKALLRRALQHRPHAVLVACHTLCSWCLPEFRTITPVPIFSVNSALLRSLQELPQSPSVALWGTTNTLQSRWFQQQLEKTRPDLNIQEQACPGLATAIENQDTKEITRLLDEYIPLQATDALALACTHYPIVRPEIAQRFTGLVLDSQPQIEQEIHELIPSFRE